MLAFAHLRSVGVITLVALFVVRFGLRAVRSRRRSQQPRGDRQDENRRRPAPRALPASRPPAATAAVVVEHLSKHYGCFPAVDDVSFELEAARIVALLGPNGAGKTTTIEVLEGFLEPTGGTVRVLGHDPRHGDRAWRSRIGLVLQSTALDLQLTVAEALELFARLYPDPRSVGEVLELVDLSDDAQTRIGALSGGQRRRVDVGLGIVGRPELLFLDEPTTGFDPAARREAWTAVQNLRSVGTTVLLTTHYLDEASHLADRVLVLDSGRLVADATPDELRRRAGGSTIRYPLPPSLQAHELPALLAAHLDAEQHALVVRTSEVGTVLESLLGWAREHSLDLAGLEIGPPSLEDAYLALTTRHEPTRAA